MNIPIILNLFQELQEVHSRISDVYWNPFNIPFFFFSNRWSKLYLRTVGYESFTLWSGIKFYFGCLYRGFILPRRPFGYWTAQRAVNLFKELCAEDCSIEELEQAADICKKVFKEYDNNLEPMIWHPGVHCHSIKKTSGRAKFDKGKAYLDDQLFAEFESRNGLRYLVPHLVSIPLWAVLKSKCDMIEVTDTMIHVFGLVHWFGIQGFQFALHIKGISIGSPPSEKLMNEVYRLFRKSRYQYLEMASRPSERFFESFDVKESEAGRWMIRKE